MTEANESKKDELGVNYEQKNVHEVYEQIAPHFSSTRYKPWPLVSKFLHSIPSGSVGLDVGTGNGKYLDINPTLYIVASDRSASLIQIASSPNSHAKDTLVADILDLPHPKRRFDFVISVAVVHHLSTKERRVAAIRVLLDHLKIEDKARDVDAGRALIYVWALEQKHSRRGWDAGHQQDVMVPWVMKNPQKVAGESNTSDNSDQTFLRYYHLYHEGELEQDIESAGGRTLDSGYEKDNWWAIATPKQ